MKSCHSFRFVFCIDIQIDFGRILRKQIFSEALFLTDLVWGALDATFDGVLSCLIKRVLPKGSKAFIWIPWRFLGFIRDGHRAT